MLTKDASGSAVMDKPETGIKPKAAAPAKKAHKIYIDGEFFDEADSNISVLDN